ACEGWRYRRNEKGGEAARCGLRGLQTVRDSIGPSAAGRHGGVKNDVQRDTRGGSGGLPGSPRPCTNMHYTERTNTIIGRICLARYWLMLDMTCSSSRNVHHHAPKDVQGDTLYSSPHWCRTARGVVRSTEARRDHHRSPSRLHGS